MVVIYKPYLPTYLYIVLLEQQEAYPHILVCVFFLIIVIALA